MERPHIHCVRLVTSEPRGELPGLERLLSEHRGVDVQRSRRPGVTDAIIDGAEWLESSSFSAFDDAVARSSSDAISVRAPPAVVAPVAVEVLTRWQRWIDLRNGASATPLFDGVLRAHEALHDVSKPLVKADLDHAVDTWHWMLRLEPEASLAAQLAALFHDVERLESEPDRRIEQHAADYAAFKDRHAARGGERAEEVLVAAGVPAATAARVREIVTSHERRGRDAEVDLLNDADALSFFSLNSAGYADYFGPEQTRKKVAYTLGRLSPRAHARLAGVRLRPDVREHLLAVEAAA
jgi:hypothetical protein